MVEPLMACKRTFRGRFWRFDATGLRPATQYELRITDADGAPLCDAWPLKTFTAPDATPEHVRILAYTCGGERQNAKPIGSSLHPSLWSSLRPAVRF
jgi:hypothetical protein